jgi:hypothetical protein
MLYEVGLRVFTAMLIRLTINILYLRASSMNICADRESITVSVRKVALIVKFTYVSECKFCFKCGYSPKFNLLSFV